MIVTEAASQGTPAVVYNVDGLRDSVQDGLTGRITHFNTPYELAHQVLRLLQEPSAYAKIRTQAWQWSKEFSLDASYKVFLKVIENES